MRALVLALAFLALGASPAAAERYAMEFRGAVFGVVGLGRATLDLDVEPDRYRAVAQIRSGGILELFERTRLRAESEGGVSDAGVTWRRYSLDHHYSRKHRAILMERTEAGLTSTITPTYRLWGQPPASEAQRLASRDPLSSLIAMGVDVARTQRCASDYLVFDGRFHYRLELRGGQRRRVDDSGYDGPALRCRLRYIPVAGFEPSDGGRRNRIPEGEIWFALIDGALFAPPVRAETPLPLGSAGLRLTRFSRPVVNVAAAAN
ncbi:MAG: DUF3108 domain-containing protein [Hyphomonadaceae bacterium]